ncbi:hypothetical protein PENTCL1PPCAC_14858, partial [Pristionchus entomophagus]
IRISAIIIFLFSIGALTAITEGVDLSASCVLKSHLCGIAAYNAMMNFYCKKTCNRDCTPFTTTTTLKPCADVTPDCANKKLLCSMTSFLDLTSQ